MTAPRVLVLGSYPAVSPRHGGQVRLSRIIAAYAARGFAVKQASFFPAHPDYTDGGIGRADVPMSPPDLQIWRGEHNAFVEDLVAGEVVAARPRLVEALERAAVAVDIVHVEQPWLFPLVERLRERGRLGPFRVVYGSQNIEHGLKREILRQHGSALEDEISDAVLALEQRCAAGADLVAAVTPEDAAVLAGWTASPVVVAPNGIAPWTSTASSREAWAERLGAEPFALYVASAHPPNIQGFADCFGPSLAALSPLQRVVLAGNASRFIVALPWFAQWKTLNERRTVALGLLSDGDLSALRDLAHAFVLPVAAGGGSSLKTAEALYSGKHVVATPMAMRGFEPYGDLPGLRIAAPGREFAAAVAAALSSPARSGDDGARARRESLTWDHSLRALCDAAERMVRA